MTAALHDAIERMIAVAREHRAGCRDAACPLCSALRDVEAHQPPSLSEADQRAVEEMVTASLAAGKGII